MKYAHPVYANEVGPLIEAPVDAGIRLRSLRHLPGASLHPRAAELRVSRLDFGEFRSFCTRITEGYVIEGDHASVNGANDR